MTTHAIATYLAIPLKGWLSLSSSLGVSKVALRSGAGVAKRVVVSRACALVP